MAKKDNIDKDVEVFPETAAEAEVTTVDPIDAAVEFDEHQARMIAAQKAITGL